MRHEHKQPVDSGMIFTVVALVIAAAVALYIVFFPPSDRFLPDNPAPVAQP